MREDGIEGNPKIYVTLKLDKNSIIEISKARGEYTESYEVMVEEKRKKKKVNTTKVTDIPKEPIEKVDAKEEGTSGKNKDIDKDDATVEKDDAEKKQDAEKSDKKEENIEDKKESDQVNATESATKEEIDLKKKIPPKMISEIRNRIKKVSLNITYQGRDVLSYTEDDFEASLKKLKDLDLQDIAVHENAAAKNKLESFIYEIRGMFGDEEDAIAKVATEEQVEEAMKEVQEAEDWLWEVEPEEESAKLFKDKLKETRKKADAIMERVYELSVRPEAIKTALANIESGKAAALEILNRTAITDEERKKLNTQVESAEKWILEKIEQQQNLSLTEKPAFTGAELVKKSESFKKFQKQLVKRPEPKKKKKKKKKKGSNDTSTAEQDNSTVTKSDNETVSENKDEVSSEKASEDDKESDSDSTSDNADDVDKGEL
jgi:hypothetical protein